MRQRRVDRAHGVQEVDLELVDERLVGAVHVERADVGDRDVDAAERFGARLDPADQRGAIGDVERPTERLDAFFLERRHGARHPVRPRAQIATWQPSAASVSAIARPMPLLPPVMMAFLPASPRSIVCPPPLGAEPAQIPHVGHALQSRSSQISIVSPARSPDWRLLGTQPWAAVSRSRGLVSSPHSRGCGGPSRAANRAQTPSRRSRICEDQPQSEEPQPEDTAVRRRRHGRNAGSSRYACVARAPSGTSIWQRTPAGANVSSALPSSS